MGQSKRIFEGIPLVEKSETFICVHVAFVPLNSKSRFSITTSVFLSSRHLKKEGLYVEIALFHRNLISYRLWAMSDSCVQKRRK